MHKCIQLQERACHSRDHVVGRRLKSHCGQHWCWVLGGRDQISHLLSSPGQVLMGPEDGMGGHCTIPDITISSMSLKPVGDNATTGPSVLFGSPPLIGRLDVGPVSAGGSKKVYCLGTLEPQEETLLSGVITWKRFAFPYEGNSHRDLKPLVASSQLSKLQSGFLLFLFFNEMA